jgi:hypothetical protein
MESMQGADTCGYTWVTPPNVVVEVEVEHSCGRDAGHRGRHICYCTDQVMNTKEQEK